MYYTIGEVAQMFNVALLISVSGQRFDVIRLLPIKVTECTPKLHRKFQENLSLVKEKGFTLKVLSQN